MTKLLRHTGQLLLVLVAVLTACNEKKFTPTPAPVSSGLTAATNETRVVELARAALECSWSDEKGLDEACPALRSWRAADDVRAATTDATLLEMTRDARPPVRWLAAVAMAGSEENEALRPLTRNPDQAQALIEAARREAHPRVARELGFAVAEIHGAPSDRAIAIRELATHHPLPALRSTVVSRVLRHNPDAYVWVANLARDERDSAVRHSAIGALRFAPPERFPATAALWLELARDKDARMAEKAASCCAFYEAICEGQWDALLDVLEAHGGMPSALWNLFSRPKASAAQKARAQKLARATLDDTRHDETVRSLALMVVADMDPALGVQLATKYLNDSEVAMATSAKIVLDEHARK